MKCTCSRADLNDALNSVARAIAVKPQTPVLAGIYLRADGNSLELQANNFSIAIKSVIPANVESAGAAVVSGKFLAAIVAKLGGEVVTLTNESESSAFTLKSEAASFALLSMNAEDFPKIRPDKPAQSFRIHRNALRNLIASTVFACSRDDSRPVFTGCLFVIDGSNITAVATNTSRIAIAKDRIIDEAPALQFIVPAAALRTLAALLSSSIESAVTVDFSGAAAAFSFGNFFMSTRLIDGAFPAWDKVVPASTAATAAVDRADLVRAIDRMLIIASHTDFQSIRFAFSDEGLAISSNAPDVGNSFEHVDAVVAGDAPDLAFNITFLADALKVFNGKSIIFGMNAPLSPVLIRGTDDESFLYVITPLRRND